MNDNKDRAAKQPRSRIHQVAAANSVKGLARFVPSGLQFGDGRTRVECAANLVGASEAVEVVDATGGHAPSKFAWIELTHGCERLKANADRLKDCAVEDVDLDAFAGFARVLAGRRLEKHWAEAHPGQHAAVERVG